MPPSQKILPNRFAVLSLASDRPEPASVAPEPDNRAASPSRKSKEQTADEANKDRQRLRRQFPAVNNWMTNPDKDRQASDLLAGSGFSWMTTSHSPPGEISPLRAASRNVESLSFGAPSHQHQHLSFQTLSAWAEETRREIIEEYGENPLASFERDGRGKLKNLASIKESWRDIAYDLYAFPSGREDKKIGHQEQDQFLAALDGLAADGSCKIKAQQKKVIKGMSPSEALETDPKKARATHFYVTPAYCQGNRHTQDREGKARLTLSMDIDQVMDMMQSIVSLPQELNNIILDTKVMAARRQGTRADSIVIYLNRIDREGAEKLAAHLETQVDANAWNPESPRGMHQFRPGISYGELSKHAVGSFGKERSSIVVEAVLKHLESGIPLDDVLREVLSARGYSPDNPAFIASSGFSSGAA